MSRRVVRCLLSLSAGFGVPATSSGTLDEEPGTLVFIRGHRPYPAFNWGDIMAIDSATGAERVVLRGRSAYEPRWSPDGRRKGCVGAGQLAHHRRDAITSRRRAAGRV